MCRGCGACHRLMSARNFSTVRCGRDVAPTFRNIDCCASQRIVEILLLASQSSIWRPEHTCAPSATGQYRQQMFLSLWSRHKSRRCSLNVFFCFWKVFATETPTSMRQNVSYGLGLDLGNFYLG